MSRHTKNEKYLLSGLKQNVATNYTVRIVVVTTSQLHSTKAEFRFCACSNPAGVVSEIRGGEDLLQWFRLEIRLKAFRRSTNTSKTVQEHEHSQIETMFITLCMSV